MHCVHMPHIAQRGPAVHAVHNASYMPTQPYRGFVPGERIAEPRMPSGLRSAMTEAHRSPDLCDLARDWKALEA